MKEIDFLERRNAAADAKKKLIEKMRSTPKPDDPAVVAARAEKASLKASNAAQRIERDRLKRESDLRQKAEDEARAVAEELSAKAELSNAADRLVAEKAEQKAERDRRYAARKNRSR